MKITRRSIYEVDVAKMRDVVYLLAPIDVSNGRGGTTRTYNTPIQVFGLVHPGGNTRELQEANLTYDNVITVYIRYYAALDQTYKLRFNGDDYTIHKSSDVDSKRRFLQLLCYTKA